MRQLAILLISAANIFGQSWPTYNGDYSGRRYSSLAQINQSNVGSLSLAWVHRASTGGGNQTGGGEDFRCLGEGPGAQLLVDQAGVLGIVVDRNPEPQDEAQREGGYQDPARRMQKEADQAGVLRYPDSDFPLPVGLSFSHYYNSLTAGEAGAARQS